MTTPLTQKAHAGAILALGLPLIGSNLAQAALHVTDTVMLGWYSVEALAAVVLGSSSFFIIFILGAGFAQAVMPMVAAALGRGDEVQVRRDTRMGMWLSILFGVAIYPLFWWSGPVLRALGQDPQIAALAQDYMRIVGLGMIPALIVTVLRSYLSALGRTQVVLWATLTGVLVNALLNWMLIFGNWGAPELGVSGAAIASVAVQVASVFILALYAARHPALRRFNLFQRFWRADWPAFAQVFRLGTPIGLTSLAEGGLFQATALMMGWIGTIELAAHGIAIQVASIAFMLHMGLAQAATVRVGTAWGRGDARGLRDGARVAFVLSQLIGVAIIAVFVAVPEQIVALFVDRTKPEVEAIISVGTSLLLVAALFQIADAAQVMALGFLRGMQDTRVPLYYAVLSYWGIGIPASWALAFPLGLGAVGLWIGLVIGLTVAAVLLFLRFQRRAPAVA